MARIAKWRNILLLVLLLGAGAATAVSLSIQRASTNFNREQFEQLDVDMTEAEVVAILGVAAGDYRPTIWSKPGWFCSPSDCIAFLRDERGRTLRQLEEAERREVDEWVRAGMPIPPPAGGVRREYWYGRTFGITIALDETNRVIHLSHWDMVPPRPPPDPWRWARWYLGV